MLTGAIAICGGGCGKILPWVTVGNGNCCDNCFQVRVYYVESVYVNFMSWKASLSWIGKYNLLWHYWGARQTLLRSVYRRIMGLG
jgi:hypothetical protein